MIFLYYIIGVFSPFLIISAFVDMGVLIRMGKIFQGFSGMDSLSAFDASGEMVFDSGWGKFVWLLGLVDIYPDNGTCFQKVLPVRFYLLDRTVIVPDIFGAERKYIVRGWRRFPSPLDFSEK